MNIGQMVGEYQARIRELEDQLEHARPYKTPMRAHPLQDRIVAHVEAQGGRLLTMPDIARDLDLVVPVCTMALYKLATIGRLARYGTRRHYRYGPPEQH